MPAASDPSTPPDRPRLTIALAIFQLRSAGGLEQQCLAIAAELSRRGHQVSLLTTTEAPALPPGVRLLRLRRRGFSNHGRIAHFVADAALAARGFDRSVVFHSAPGFHVIYCAATTRAGGPAWRRLLPRYRSLMAIEARAFAPDARSRVLMLASAQLAAYQMHHHTPAERCFVLPPSVDPARLDPSVAPRAPRSGRGPVWLWVGLQPNTKGLDRAVAALATASDARLLVSGLGRDHPKARPALRQARRLGVAERIDWLGFLDNDGLKAAMGRADLLLHPARLDVTGNVILEALINGLPVVVTAVCGFAEHVGRADAGVVLAEPFRQGDLDAALAAATPETVARWSASALGYCARTDFFSGVSRAADLIEEPPL